jgi:hypothetical protein
MTNRDLKIPMNIQFFAEPTATEPTNEPTTNEPTATEPTSEPTATEPKADDDKSKEPTTQELLVELAKIKRAQEKAASEAAEWKKKYNATLSEKERFDLEAAERKAAEEEENAKILRENKIFKLEKEYLGAMGYTASEAERMAIAEVDDDKEAKIKIMAEVKAREKKEWEQEFMKNRPQLQAGVGSKETDITKEQFNKMGYQQRVEFKRTYPELYKKYTE